MLDDLSPIPTGFSGYRVLQTRSELDSLINLMLQERVFSYLEIGAHFGDTLHEVGVKLPSGSKLVGIDLPGATAGGHTNSGALLATACEDLETNYEHESHFFLGNSLSKEAVEFAKQHAPYDIVFIDGSHEYDDVYKDWDHYGTLSRMVAFHDINKVGGKWNGGVRDLWNQLKKTHRHVEFSARDDKRGIGVLWKNSQS